MVERLLIAILIVVVGVTLWVLYNRISIARLSNTSSSEPVLTTLQKGIPAIVYFTTPFCEPCRTLQKPALEQLKADFGEAVQVVTIDSLTQPEIADRWGVMSAPTTFILDGSLKPRTVNRGVASAETLKRQLSRIV